MSSTYSESTITTTRSRKLSRVATEELFEKERKATAKLLKKTIASTKKRGMSKVPIQDDQEAEVNDAPPVRKIRRSALAVEAARILKEAADKANKDEEAETKINTEDGSLSIDDEDEYSVIASPGQPNEDVRISTALEAMVTKRMLASGSATRLWPTPIEMSAAISGMVAPVVRTSKVAPLSALFVKTVDKVTNSPESAVLSLAIICPGSDVPTGAVFVTLPDDTGDDKNIHDFYQVRGVPSSRFGLRKATKIITSRGDATANGNLMDADDITDILFGPTDKLCTLPIGGVTQVLYVSSIVSWATEEYFEPITSCEPNLTSAHPLAPAYDSSNAAAGTSHSHSVPNLEVLKSARPHIRYASVPREIEITKKYPHAPYMFQVSQPIINTAIVSSSKENKGENGILEAIKASAGSTGSTMRKLGMSTHTLHVLSVAASEALKATLQEVRKRFNQRVDCPINMVVMSHYIQSWVLSDAGSGIKSFVGLEVFHGNAGGEAYARKYNSIDDLTAHSKAYLTLVEQLEFRHFATDLNVMKNAAKNILLLLFIMHNMRFCFQSGMLDALDRLFVYIKMKDFGPSSGCSADFIRLCLVEFFNNLDDFRARLSESRDDSESVSLLEELSLVPDLGISSPIILIQECMYHAYGRNVAQMLIAGVGDSDRVQENGEDKPKANKNKNRKDRQKAKVLSGLPKPPAPPSQLKVVVPPAFHNTSKNDKRKSFCIMFNSKKGCQYGNSCKFAHEVPPLGSDQWSRLENIFSERGVEATAAFVAGGP